ncbi:oocyte zinc finger protein XlCOF6.1 [Anabrus simplex]|uniref:oocyte zinc finger protein XlCOF6.1 n=1 Tax=Anabrus simplex TaxID=316456 RepID=UPI0035A3A073
MDHKIGIKDEPVWFEGTAGSSFDNYELTTEETPLKEETKSELAEPGQTQPCAGIKDEICVDEHTVGQLVPCFKEEDNFVNAALLTSGPVDTCDRTWKELKKKNRREVVCKLLPHNVRNLRLSSHSGSRSVHPIKQRALCCNECGETFPNKSDLLRHLPSHTEVCQLYCNDCGKCFSDKRRLMKHVHACIGENQHWNNDSAKRFRDITLSMHALRGFGDRPNACGQCGRTFSRTSQLQRHVHTHTGERPELCRVCGKRFRDKSMLSRHMRRHTGERPFFCKDCGKGFSDKRALDNHRRTHTGDRPYACYKCAHTFSLITRLKAHLLVHSGER